MGVYFHKPVQNTVELGQGASGEERAAPGEVQEIPLHGTLQEGTWCTEWGSGQGSPRS